MRLKYNCLKCNYTSFNNNAYNLHLLSTVHNLNLNTLIPRVIYQTFKTKDLTQDILDIINNNKKLCPEYTFILYDDLECNAFIKENFDENVYKAYMKINPKLGAMKADFWRYCILYINGGIYLDIKSSFKINLDLILNNNNYTCILDELKSYEKWRKDSPTYEQWLLIFAKNHIYLKNMIEDMTKNILNNYIPEVNFVSKYSSLTKQKVLFVTGPDAFTRVIKDHNIKKNKLKLKEHVNINYKDIATYGSHKIKLKLYEHNNLKHYSEIQENLYIE